MNLSESESRRIQVLALFDSPTWYQACQIARLLNLEPDGNGGYRITYACEWCPVLQPRDDTRPSRVPLASLRRVVRVLQSLVESGDLQREVMARGRVYYHREEKK